MPTMNLYAETLKLLRDRPASLQLKTISEETKISYSWILKFHQNHKDAHNPSYARLQSLHDYLVSK